jgi:hypothetical protein
LISCVCCAFHLYLKSPHINSKKIYKLIIRYSFKSKLTKFFHIYIYIYIYNDIYTPTCSFIINGDDFIGIDENITDMWILKVCVGLIPCYNSGLNNKYSSLKISNTG